MTVTSGVKIVEGKLEAPKHLARGVHILYFEPKSRTIWSLSNAFTSTFKELEPIPEFKPTAKVGEFLETRFSQSFVTYGGTIRLPIFSSRSCRSLPPGPERVSAPESHTLRGPWTSQAPKP